jgi:hypothetical protein
VTDKAKDLAQKGKEYVKDKAGSAKDSLKKKDKGEKEDQSTAG